MAKHQPPHHPKQPPPPPEPERVEKPFGELPPGTPFRACGANYWKSNDPAKPLWALHELDPEKDQEFYPQVKVNPPSPNFSTERNPANQVEQPSAPPQNPPPPDPPKPPEPPATPPAPPQPVVPSDPLAVK